MAALATSKRKFYKLLDNISSPKLSPDDPNTTPGAKANKRSRMVVDSTTASSRPYAAPRTTTTVRILSSNFESRETDRPESRTGSYSPWSHEQFLARLKTYADVKIWSPKPDVINEVAWAGRGWVAVARDEVACKSCGEHVLIKLESNKPEKNWENEKDKEEQEPEEKWWTAETETSLVEKYESLIIEAHERTCLWKKSGCKGMMVFNMKQLAADKILEDIYRISFSDPTAWVKSLCQRYTSLEDMGDDILPTSVIVPLVREDDARDQFEPDEIKPWFASVMNMNSRKHLKSQKNAESIPTLEAADINTTALVMALCGWEGQDQSRVNIATCDRCFSRVGLWMYKTGDDHKLDPVSLHRAHCPWQNPVSQAGLGRFEGLAGWEVLNEVICSNITRASRQRGLVAPLDDDADHADSPRRSREELDDEDQARESKLARLKRALTGKRSKKSFDQPR
jgi:hypothetical protein